MIFKNSNMIKSRQHSKSINQNIVPKKSSKFRKA